MKTKGKRGLFAVALMAVLLAACVLVSCGSVKTDDEQSPHLVGAAITSYNEGSEDSQFVELQLTFDREITVNSGEKESLRITISGDRVSEDEYTLESGEDACTARLIISTDAVTKGVLLVEKATDANVISAILDEEGKYAAWDFELEAIIPSGVTLSTVESEAGRVVKSVDTYWAIRSIAWVGLTEDGELIPVAETATLEMLDGYAAVHGHEFLMEDEDDIAEKIVEVLEDNYSEDYTFSSDGNQITVEKSGGEETLDLVIYEYLKIDGELVEAETADMGADTLADAENSGDSSETTGEDSDEESENSSVVKSTEINREVTEEEQAFLNCLHTSSIVEDGITDGTELYQTLIITGEAMPEEQVYSVRDLETLIEISFENQEMNAYGLPMEWGGYVGLDFSVFLDLCGASTEGMTLLLEDADGVETSYNLDDLAESDAVLFLALGQEEGPLHADSSPVSGPAALCISYGDTTQWVEGLSRVTIGEGEEPEDPEYRFHNREPYLDSADVTFTVEVYQQGSEYLGALKTVTFTTEEMEQLMEDNPSAVRRNYYGTIGNEPLFEYLGVGGWFDCFEGLDLLWLLTEQVGIEEEDLTGYAELVGRDGEVYGTIDDLAYITEASQVPEEYYTLTEDGVKVTGTTPMIACVKNAYPILPEHDHESEAYVAYNALNQRLESDGVVTEIGVVKNHNGPFVACLGNRDGYYGGNQIETGGDCVLIRFYLK